MATTKRVVVPRTNEKPQSYLNVDTGDVMNILKLKDISDKNTRFFKVTKTEFYEAMSTLSGSEILAFIYMFDHMSITNVCLGTYVEFQEKLGVSNKTMIKTMVNLQKHDLIRMVHPAQWMINPKYVVRCADNGIPELSAAYAMLKSFEEKKRKKKEEAQNDADQ